MNSEEKNILIALVGQLKELNSNIKEHNEILESRDNMFGEMMLESMFEPDADYDS
jgi:hypothetical protein